jgi:hypothetical protein
MYQSHIAKNILLVLTGMMVASLAAYFLLTTLGFSVRRLEGETLPPASSVVVTGKVTSIQAEASTTMVTLKTDTGTSTVLLATNGAQCPSASNIADVHVISIGDTLAVRGSQVNAQVSPCKNASDYVKVIKDAPLADTIATTSSNIYSNGVGRRATPATTTPTTSAVVSTKFTGILQSVDTGCFADGECFVIVAGKRVTVLRGWSKETVGSVVGVPGFGDLESHIGGQVEVRAAMSSDGTYTLYGDPNYYVKVLP